MKLPFWISLLSYRYAIVLKGLLEETDDERDKPKMITDPVIENDVREIEKHSLEATSRHVEVTDESDRKSVV